MVVSEAADGIEALEQVRRLRSPVDPEQLLHVLRSALAPPTPS